MAIKFQYNKTSLGDLGKKLKMRQSALPTLKNKESALRMAVVSCKAEAQQAKKDLEEAMTTYDHIASLWNEFRPDLISIKDVDLKVGKVAGVKVPLLGDIT